MAKQRKEVHNVRLIGGNRDIIQQLFPEYSIESVNAIQDALKDTEWHYRKH